MPKKVDRKTLFLGSAVLMIIIPLFFLGTDTTSYLASGFVLWFIGLSIREK